MRQRAIVLRVAAWLAALLLICVVAVPMLHRGWMTLGTDFPNYYLLAHLRADGGAVDRAYEWIWLQRQKDHLGLQQPLVGLGQITPFSAAVLWPVAKLSAMATKHAWMLVNGVFLVASLLLLRRIARARVEVLLLLAACCVPLWRNFEYGQFYLFLLVLLLLALALERDGESWGAGFLIGMAGALKVFPLLLLIVPLAKGRLRTAGGAVVGLLVATAVSVQLFGREFCRRYAVEVLPRGLRGDVADPYSLGNVSLGAMLRRLFVFDAGLNPRPVAHAPVLANLLNVLFGLLLLGLVWRAARRAREEDEDVVWSLAISASLLVSTAPASYQFVLLLLPVCVLVQRSGENWKRLIVVVAAYVAAVAPWPLAQHAWLAWVMPRWIGTLALFPLLLVEAGSQKQHNAWTGRQKRMAVAAAVCASGVIVFAVRKPATIAQLQYAGKPGALYEGRPQWLPDGLHGVRLESSRYSVFPLSDKDENLSLAAAGERQWVEQEQAAPMLREAGVSIQGQAPALSSSGAQLVFVREVKGQGILYSAGSDGSNVRRRTGEGFDVSEAVVDDRGGIYLSAQQRGEYGPRVYVLEPEAREPRLLIGERSRYPAASPDGVLLAYSEEVHGSWRLRLMNLRDGSVLHLTDAPCNVIEPAWKDTRTLLVASDCGRGLGLTGIFELRLP